MKKTKKKKVIEKEAEDLNIFTYCHGNWNFLIATIFSILFVCLRKYHCWSTCFSPYFYYGLLGSLHHTSMDNIVLRLLVVPPLLFPFFNLVFQKVSLQWSLFEMELDKIYSFFFFEQLWRHAFTFKCFTLLKFMRCLKAL